MVTGIFGALPSACSSDRRSSGNGQTCQLTNLPSEAALTAVDSATLLTPEFIALFRIRAVHLLTSDPTFSAFVSEPLPPASYLHQATVSSPTQKYSLLLDCQTQ